MRVELIHPMLVHFPIALLLTGTVLRGLCYFIRKTPFYHLLLFSARLILGIGVIFVWLTVAAGELAEGVVRKNLCLPEILEEHSTLGYTTAYLFTIGVILDLLRSARKLARWRKAFTGISAILLLVGSGILLTTAFFGGKLVYEQGAAVEKVCPPSAS
jgi:uncharacterized membrane protein